jgi:hypothetical protein
MSFQELTIAMFQLLAKRDAVLDSRLSRLEEENAMEVTEEAATNQQLQALTEQMKALLDQQQQPES